MMRVRIRGIAAAAASAAVAMVLSCSGSSSTGPDGGGDIRGRIAWSSPTARSEEIFVADVLIEAARGALGPDAIAVRPAGPGVYTATVGGRQVTIRAAVFREGAAHRSADSAGFHATNVRQVTNNRHGDYAPAINPRDWDQVFYHSPRGGSLGVYMTDLRSGRETTVRSRAGDPNFDGEGRLLFADNGIWRYDPATGELALLFEGRVDDPVDLRRGAELLIFFNSPTAWTGQPFAGKANFVLETANGRVHKLTATALREDNPVPSADGELVVWHAWDGPAASVYYGRLRGYAVPEPGRIAFRDADTGLALSGNCWYASWVGADRILFHNEDRVYLSDLQGNARDTGLRGSEISLVD